MPTDVIFDIMFIVLIFWLIIYVIVFVIRSFNPIEHHYKDDSDLNQEPTNRIELS